MAADLARAANISSSTAHRFLTESVQTPHTAKKIADALEQPLARYVIGA